MSVTCEKDFEITVASGARILYWTMEELVGNRVDEVEGVSLPVAGDTSPGNNSGRVVQVADPGLYGNGLHFSFNNPGWLQSFVGSSLGYFGDLKQDGNGFSVCVWLKINSLGNRFATIGYFGGQPNPNHIDCFYHFLSGTTLFRTGDAAGNSENLAVAAPPIGSWFMLHLFYDPTVANFGFSINNGAETYSGYSPVMAANLEGLVQAFQLGTTGFTPNDWQCDEMLVRLDARLTPAQLTYLYNGGAGRTWPITLP